MTDTALYGTRWAIVGLRNGWKMPAAPWWKRLPVIRVRPAPPQPRSRPVLR